MRRTDAEIVRSSPPIASPGSESFDRLSRGLLRCVIGPGLCKKLQLSLRFCCLGAYISIALLGIISARAEIKNFMPSAEGYYEGSVIYSCNYLKGVGYASMVLKDKADFWMTLTRNGPGSYAVNGQGTAIFDFSYAIDWTMGVKAGVSMLNVLGAKIDPKVTISLDPKTSVQKFYLTGEVSPQDAKDGGVKLQDVALSWTPPGDDKAQKPKLKLLLVGSVSMDVSGSGNIEKDLPKGPNGKPIGKMTGEGSIGGGKLTPGTVTQTIEFDPPPPFGSDKFTLVLKKRSPYGPLADEYDITAPGQGASIEVTVHWAAVQKIDFGWFKNPAQLAANGPPGANGGNGADGQSGPAGQSGSNGKNGRDGQKGDAGAKGDDNRSAQPNWRSGSVTVKAGQDTPVTFSSPMSTADYVVTLAPTRNPGLWIGNYSQKTPQGFMLRAEPANQADASSATTTIDWMVVPAQ